MPESTAQIAEAGLRQEQYLTLLGLEKAISSHRNIPNLFRDLACRLQDLFKFRDIGVMLHDETRNVMRLYVLEACEDLYVNRLLRFQLKVLLPAGSGKTRNRSSLVISTMRLAFLSPRIFGHIRQKRFVVSR